MRLSENHAIQFHSYGNNNHNIFLVTVNWHLIGCKHIYGDVKGVLLYNMLIIR